MWWWSVFLIHTRMLLTSSYPYDIKFLEKFILSGSLLWASLYWERAPACANACRCWRRMRRRRWRQESWSSSPFSSGITKSTAIPAGQELRVWLIIYYFYFEYILFDSKSPSKTISSRDCCKDTENKQKCLGQQYYYFYQNMSEL